MSSRKERKEQLREERLSRERAAAASERRRQLLSYGVGGLLGLAAVAAIVIAVAAGGGGDGGNGPGDGGIEVEKVAIPKQRETDLDAAAKKAGCKLRTFTPKPNDRLHTPDPQTYKQNPPVFGQHNPTWASDGDYSGQGPPDTGKVVHALEHGRVAIWFDPKLPKRRIGQLATLYAEPMVGKPQGYKQLLVARSGMPAAVAASSWGQQIVCRRFGDASFDALRAFRTAYVDKGPENVPFPE